MSSVYTLYPCEREYESLCSSGYSILRPSINHFLPNSLSSG